MRVLWALPVTVALALALMPVNDGLYEFLVNFDPQGEGQQWEWRYYSEVMRRTSGVLAGHLLTFGVGVALGRRRRLPVAAIVATVTGTVLGLAVLGTARLAGGARLRTGGDGLPLWEPGVPLEEPRYWALFLAFPLFALVGALVGALIGDGRLRSRTLIPLMILAVIGWLVLIIAGLSLEGRSAPPVGWLWLLPPLAAAQVINLAALSVSAEAVPPVVVGDWGKSAAIALVGGLTGWAVLLGVAARWRSRATARRYGEPES